MEKRIFILGIVIILLFSISAITLSYNGLEEVNIRKETLFIKKEHQKDLEVKCSKLGDEAYIPIMELPNIINGEVILDREGILFKTYIDFPDTDYLNGERFIYGTILRIDYDNRDIIIEQDMDDNSLKASPTLKIREDAIFILQRNQKRMNIDFKDLKVGDRFGIVLDKVGLVRGMIIFV